MFDPNPCAAALIDPNIVGGKAVLLPAPASCSFEIQYGNLAGAGAAAIIVEIGMRPPGITYNLYGGGAPATGLIFDIVLAEISYDADLERRLRAEPQPIRVRLRLDPNPWASALRSWPYELLLRWSPAALFAASALASFAFIVAHARWRRSCPVSVVYVALLIRVASSTLLALKFALSGTLSTWALPDPMQWFLLPQLTGFTFVTIMMTSTIWNRIRLAITGQRPAPIVRLLSSNCTRLAYVVVVAGDLTIASSLAMHKSQVLVWMPQISSAFYGVCLALAGPQLIISSVQLGRVSHGVNGSLTLYLDRMRLIVASLGVMIIIYIVGFLMYAVDGAITSTSWIFIWSWLTICHGIIAVLQVWLFHPALSAFQNMTLAPIIDKNQIITVLPRSAFSEKSSFTPVIETHRRTSSFTPLNSMMLQPQ